MNRTQIANSVQRNLDDLNANFYSLEDDIYPAIQDGYDLVAALCETIESSSPITFVSNKTFYDFKTLIPTYLRVFGIYNNNTNRWMEPATLMDLYKLRDDWECCAGEPYLFLPIDWRTVAIFPQPASAVGTMTVLFKATADTLGVNSSPEIPLSEHNALENYATSDLLDQAQEFSKAMDHAKLFNVSVDEILKQVRNRQRPNHLFFKHG